MAGVEETTNAGEGRWAGMNERMDRIRLKQLLAADELSEQELMCLQIEQNGFSCHACPEEKR